MQCLKEVRMVQNIVIEKVFLSSIHFINHNVDRLWQICIKLLWKVSAHSVLEGTAAQHDVRDKHMTAKKTVAAVGHQESISRMTRAVGEIQLTEILKFSINSM